MGFECPGGLRKANGQRQNGDADTEAMQRFHPSIVQTVQEARNSPRYSGPFGEDRQIL